MNSSAPGRSDRSRSRVPLALGQDDALQLAWQNRGGGVGGMVQQGQRRRTGPCAVRRHSSQLGQQLVDVQRTVLRRQNRRNGPNRCPVRLARPPSAGIVGQQPCACLQGGVLRALRMAFSTKVSPGFLRSASGTLKADCGTMSRANLASTARTRGPCPSGCWWPERFCAFEVFSTRRDAIPARQAQRFPLLAQMT